MTHTTITIDNPLKLQPKPLDIIALRQMIGSWKKAGLTYSQIFKIEKLYLGETGWMNQQGEYPRNNFYEIAKGLKFNSIIEMMKSLKRCRGFGFAWMGEKQDSIDSISGIFSELWHDAAENEIVTYPAVCDDQSANPAENGAGSSDSANCCVQHSANCCDDNNNININNNILSNKDYINRSKLLSAGHSKLLSAEQVFSEFLLYLTSDQGAYDAIVKPINEQTERLMPELKVQADEQPNGAGLQDGTGQPNAAQPDPRPVNAATDLFLKKYLGQYLISQGRKFVNNSLVGRKIWVQNLMRYAFMQRNVTNAVTDIRAQMEKDALVIARGYHPLSPFEYTEKKTGRRFYDFVDEQGRKIVKLIPDDAPARPSGESVWDRFGKGWYQLKNSV